MAFKLDFDLGRLSAHSQALKAKLNLKLNTGYLLEATAAPAAAAPNERINRRRMDTVKSPRSVPRDLWRANS